MTLKGLEARVWLILARTVSSDLYPFIVGAIAWLLTVTMTAVLLAPILIGAILLRRDRWIAIVALASLGGAFGSLLLFLAFRHLGWNQLVALYPDVTTSRLWATTTRWISAYGAWALAVVAASPLPQMPALILTAVSGVPATEVFAALLCGRLIKYTVYGWLTSRFPNWVQRFAERRGRRFGQIAAFSSVLKPPRRNGATGTSPRSGWRLPAWWKIQSDRD